MAQAFYGTVSLSAAAPSNINVQLGFTPGRVELINLTKVQAPVAARGWKAVWQNGMAQGSSVNTVYGAGLFDATVYNAANGITWLNPLGSERAQYGSIVSNFTNAANGVITVDSTAQLNIAPGSRIRVASLADNQTGTGGLNGDYDVLSVTPTTITVVQSTVGKAVYVSGGFVTTLQDSNPIAPNPPFNIYGNVPTVFNSAIQGFTIGIGAFPNATYSLATPDLILVSAWDFMQP